MVKTSAGYIVRVFETHAGNAKSLKFLHWSGAVIIYNSFNHGAITSFQVTACRQIVAKDGDCVDARPYDCKTENNPSANTLVSPEESVNCAERHADKPKGNGLPVPEGLSRCIKGGDVVHR